MANSVQLARPGSKRATAIEIMNANARRKPAEVLELIEKAAHLKHGEGRSYYRWLVLHGLAKGRIDRLPVNTRGRKPMAAE